MGVTDGGTKSWRSVCTEVRTEARTDVRTDVRTDDRAEKTNVGSDPCIAAGVRVVQALT